MVFPLLRQSAGVTKNSKSQISNIKWFDKLTTLSQVEGQITMTEIQNSKPVLVILYWNLRFVCNLVLGVWDFINSSIPIQLAIFTGNPATGGTNPR